MLIDLCLATRGVESLTGTGVRALGELAARLGVESYLLDVLGPSQRRLEAEAAGWLATLRSRVAASAVDNLRRDRELSEALGRLTEEGIEIILLKGSALRLTRVGLAGRYQCDVDVLLRRPDLERAEALLTGMGFHLDESVYERQSMLDSHFHLGFERHGAVVELHWDVDRTSPPGFVDRLWAASGEAELDGRPMRVLSPEHQLLFGCLHLSRHGFHGGLRWLADLRGHFPLAPGVAAAFEKEARAWLSRPVRCPLWALGDLGVSGALGLAGDGFADPLERTLLRRFLVPLLLAEPWLGIPAWRLEHALRDWLFSDRFLPAVLAEYSGQGMSSRLRAWAAGTVEEGA